MKKKYTVADIKTLKAQAMNELDILNGRGSHATWSNICYGDGYFAASLKRKWGVELDKLEKWASTGQGAAKPGKGKMPPWD